MIGLTILGIIATLISNGLDAAALDNVGYYSETAVVFEVNYEEDCVSCVSFNGNEWGFEGCEDWAEGDVCSMLMCDNGTEEVYDDIVVSTKYCGWVDYWGWDNGKPMIEFDF